jgi:hypothetical protein
LSIGVMMFKLMRLPRRFPQFNFVVDYRGVPKSSPGRGGNPDSPLP